MQSQTVIYNYDYIFGVTDYFKWIHGPIFLFLIIFARNDFAYFVHGAMVLFFGGFEAIKLTRLIWFWVNCPMFWVCFTPGIPGSTTPSQEFLWNFWVTLFFVIQAPIQFIINLILHGLVSKAEKSERVLGRVNIGESIVSGFKKKLDYMFAPNDLHIQSGMISADYFEE